MQDLTGVPAVVDLATMREAMRDLGGDPAKINPLVPAELVIDHSVVADVFGRPTPSTATSTLSSSATASGSRSCAGASRRSSEFKVVPPGTGIVHQVNIEHLARVVMAGDGAAYPDTCVGTDSHTTMQNGLGVLGWGVGGIEAEAAMLGQPISMLIPKVVGFQLTGELPEGATATDLVLTITEMLRRHGVVGKFVEFHGDGVAAVPVANRATIGNMSPEFGSTCAIFPIDGETLTYLRLTGRSANGSPWSRRTPRSRACGTSQAPARYSEELSLDLSTVVPSLAGPKRPQDRVALADAKTAFREALGSYVQLDRLDDEIADTFPASDPFLPDRENGGDARRRSAHAGRKPGPPVRARRGHARGRHQDGGRSRLGRDRGHHLVHQHLEPVGDDRRRAAGPQGGGGRAGAQAVVKTTLAPGSKVVMDYYERAGLLPYLEKLGFNLVGYGCTTCIGNSGPLPEQISQAVADNDLAVVSVLSGNRNFEGRINPDVKMNYLASPPLVVAYALAGTMD